MTGTSLELVGQVLALQAPSPADMTWWRAGLLALLIATSQILGNVVVLAVNRVRWPEAMGLCVVGAFDLVLGQALLALFVWFGASLVTPGFAPLSLVVLVTIFCCAPLLFSFLEMAPVLGPLLGRLLIVWNALAMWVTAERHLVLDHWLSLLLVMAAWAAQRLVLLAVRPLIWRARRALHQSAFGHDLTISPTDLLARQDMAGPA